MHKGQEEAKVKVRYEFGNQWKCVLNIREKWKLTIKLKILELYRIRLLTNRLWFLMEHFLSWVFYVGACTYSFLFHLQSLNVLHNKWCSPHYVKRDYLKELVNQRKMYYFHQCSSYFILFLAKTIFDMCFDNFIKFCALHYYYKTQSIWNQPIIYASNTSML
jgi:hypothetical protein